MAKQKIQLIPKQRRFKGMGRNFIAGTVGGLATGIFSDIIGITLGSLAGAVVGGAMVGGKEGQIVAVNGIMDSIASLFVVPSTSRTRESM
jgi:hypothetical protein